MQKSKDNTVIHELVKGGLVGSAVFIVITLLICLFIFKANLSKGMYLPLLMVISALSGVTSGFSAVRKKRENGLLNGLAASVIPTITMLTAMTIAYKGFSIFETVIAACCMFGGAIGGIGAVNIKKKRKPIKKR